MIESGGAQAIFRVLGNHLARWGDGVSERKRTDREPSLKTVSFNVATAPPSHRAVVRCAAVLRGGAGTAFV
jgi:hypothetical protein